MLRIKDLGINIERHQSRDRFYGIWKGICEYNDDPLNLGRIKARVFEIYGTVTECETFALPWAIKIDMVQGAFSVPEVGTSVAIMFEQGYVEHPVYLGVTYGIPIQDFEQRGRMQGLQDPKPLDPFDKREYLQTPDQQSAVDPGPPPARWEGPWPPDWSGPKPPGWQGDWPPPRPDGWQGPWPPTTTQPGPHGTMENTWRYEQKALTNEVPEESLNRTTRVPTIHVLVKTPYGHTIYASDEREAEQMRIIDRIGQELIFYGPVDPKRDFCNFGYRYEGEAVKGNSIVDLDGCARLVSATNEGVNFGFWDQGDSADQVMYNHKNVFDYFQLHRGNISPGETEITPSGSIHHHGESNNYLVARLRQIGALIIDANEDHILLQHKSGPFIEINEKEIVITTSNKVSPRGAILKVKDDAVYIDKLVVNEIWSTFGHPGGWEAVMPPPWPMPKDPYIMDLSATSPGEKTPHSYPGPSGSGGSPGGGTPPEGAVGPCDRRKIYQMGLAIQEFEGWFPGSRSFRNNNPGNLKFANQKGAIGKDSGGFAIFPDYATGFAALQNQIMLACDGKSVTFHPTDTLYEFFAKYAPGPGSAKYAEFVAKKMGVSASTPLNQALATSPHGPVDTVVGWGHKTTDWGTITMPVGGLPAGPGLGPPGTY